MEVPIDYPIRADRLANGPECLTTLIQEKEQLTRAIELTWQSVTSCEQSKLAAEGLTSRHLNSEREAWIRAAVRSKDQVLLDSLYLDLERVTKQIDSLTPQVSTGIRLQESQA